MRPYAAAKPVAMLFEHLPVLASGLMAFWSVESASGSDACADTAIETAAEVTVSDGMSFRTESFFHARDSAAIRHIDDGEQVIVVEGPLTWIRPGDDSERGGAELARFALGHQFHAFLWRFDELVPDVEMGVQIKWNGLLHAGRRGRHPYGGSVALVGAGDRPVALLIDDPDSGRIEARYDDW